jgi:flagellar protein FlaG
VKAWRSAEEAFVEINGVNRTAHALPVIAAEVRDNRAAENRDVVQAVKALNGTEMFGQDNQLMFQRDTETQRMVVRVVNTRTKEVISQIPQEYVLRLAEDMKPKRPR